MALEARPGALRSPWLGRVLAAHCFQGDTNDCGPCCAAMALGGLAGRAVPAAELGAWLERQRLGGVLPIPLRLPGSATFPWGLAALLRAGGLGCRWRPGGSEAALRRALAAGRLPLVVLGGWRPAWAHWVVVLAWDPARGWGLGDPGRPEAELAWLPAGTFRTWWRAWGRVLVEAWPGHRG